MRRYFGRTQIFTDETEINSANVVAVIQKAMNIHRKNASEIKYLYNYYKGKQPIYLRQKEIRPEICNKIVENWAYKIVSFKVGYICGSPIQYVSANTEKNVSDSIDNLNNLMEYNGKATLDKELFEWQYIAGTSYRMVLPSDDLPFSLYTLDPMLSFVIYSNDYRKKKLAGVTYSVSSENGAMINTYSVYTDDRYFEIKDNEIVKNEPNLIGIPIFEYPANNARLSAIEIVIDLLNAINDLDSNRLDGVNQFIQSLIVVYNATLGDATSNEIRDKGLIELKSIGENKADIKVISEELSQDQTQTLKNDLIQRVREIVGLPSQGSGDTGDSSNNGAQLLKGGWEDAETRAKATETMFKKNETDFLKTVLFICSNYVNNDIKLEYKDVAIQFTRRNYENLQSKAQVLTSMLATEKINPKLAFQSSGMFTDPEKAYRESQEYYERVGRTEQSNNTVPNNGGNPESGETV